MGVEMVHPDILLVMRRKILEMTGHRIRQGKPAAFDQDPATAWRTSAFGSPVGEFLRVDFDETRSLDELTLLQPVTGEGGLRYRIVPAPAEPAGPSGLDGQPA